jgi:hypothetical protein
MTMPINNNTFSAMTQSNLWKTLQPQANSTQAINEAKQLRQLKIQALKDKQYLNQEKIFIETLKTSLNRSFSLNQLNKMIS